MRKFFLFILILAQLHELRAANPDNETICSRRYKYCFQIPPNQFMLTTNDIESSVVTYRTVDGASTLALVNGSMNQAEDFHRLYLMVLGQWTDHNYTITLKREYPDFFIVSGFTRLGRGFYQKVLRIDNDYVSAYLEFPKGSRKFSNVSKLLFDHFVRSASN